MTDLSFHQADPGIEVSVKPGMAQCAEAIIDGLAPIGLHTRVGIHVGECEIHEGKLAGIAVVVGARISSLAGPGEVLVSGTVRDLVAGSGLVFAAHGHHQLKGVPGERRLFSVVSQPHATGPTRACKTGDGQRLQPG